jgi:hypothetical protein
MAHRRQWPRLSNMGLSSCEGWFSGGCVASSWSNSHSMPPTYMLSTDTFQNVSPNREATYIAWFTIVREHP